MDIPANQTFTTVTVSPRDDSAAEGAETAIFTIAPNSAYRVGNAGSATIQIADNDALPRQLLISPIAHRRAPIASAANKKLTRIFSEDLI